MNQSAASAASLDDVKFPAVIKGTKTQGSARATASASGRRPRGAPLGLGSLDLVFGEAALAVALIAAWNFTESREAALAADLFTDFSDSVFQGA